MSDKHHQISTKRAEEILFELFDIKGNASRLPGEIDINFRIKIKNEEGYILKISRPDEDQEYYDFQKDILQFIEKQGGNIIAPRVISDKFGKCNSRIKNGLGEERNVRLLTWVSGRIWNTVHPRLEELHFSLGKKCGLLTKVLDLFQHPLASRKFDWDISQSLWTKEYNDLFKDEELEIISYFQNRFESKLTTYSELRKGIVHNDANDNNIVVSSDLISPKVRAIIDYGDAIKTEIINDVAITCAYAIMSHIDPLEIANHVIKGYHSSFTLQEEDLEHLYNAIGMRLVITVTKAAINKIENPENKYLLISEKPAWELLKKWYRINEEYATLNFRESCGFAAHPLEEKFNTWAKKKVFKLTDLFPTVHKNKIHLLDLSVSSKWIGHREEYNDPDFFQYRMIKLRAQNPDKIIAGGYLEPRPVYDSSSYHKIGNKGKENRTIHLGIDFWLPAETAVHALFDGQVIMALNNTGDKQYGGLIVLKHNIEDLVFYTLYGHLSIESALKKKAGTLVKKGEPIALLGNYPENVNWATHLHFQIMLTIFDFKDDFPGVAYYDQINIWKSVCPDPNLLFKLKTLEDKNIKQEEDVFSYRKKHLGKSLSLQYEVPIWIVRGDGPYLFDQNGKKYLDTVNNVAHVGHENYTVVNAGQNQMALLNTNTRYLNENINDLTRELLKTLPKELSVVHFVNSGSEAIELAFRMVKAATGNKDIIVSEMGYHGNSNYCVDISSYKFDRKGGTGAPEHTHVIPLPDAFRGKYRGLAAAEKYADEVKEQILNIQSKNRSVGAFIIEPIISCGGQIELPQGFLKKAYGYIKEAGGLCISDEVQVGCGRFGKTFWGFQYHDVIPDIVTIGKPLGNGHPLAAVVCTKEVADKFANGMEYFNTFGGNPVSCAIGLEVLKTIKKEKLQENALQIGEYLKEELKLLALKYPIIGDVRGQGLFLGFELVNSEMQALGEKTNYLMNRMKDYGILMSSDGPDHNVLKIKPPLVFSKENADDLILTLKKVFSEDFMTAD
jgi:4-aminobutyrate aminotransferase-like enzyme/Ser/Thr protein kinase RdoA (MazF antagonist)